MIFSYHFSFYKHQKAAMGFHRKHFENLDFFLNRY
ncbi:hypothetical protein RUMTOR_00019 [[Ruminococcus] torques ATCC 27756]|uniref:Uncharacterized protein n=1 Tax=[Ruminococcus] torques ATCC 27756 TaxID=411460 RepID=A5KIH4_9FIRM|nr:hypothetical protein RUMTOR_00019 [[Ruminococcus] torques ATCC 27756]